MAVLGAAVPLWSSNQARRRWRGLLLLGVMAGAAAGLTTAAVVGAHQTATAYSRMRSQDEAADAVVFPSQVGISDADMTKLAQLPEVAAWMGFSLPVGQFDEQPPGAGPFGAFGSDWFTSIEKPTVLAGRLPDPSRDDEAVVTQSTIGMVHLGETLTLRTYSPQDAQTLGEPGPSTDWKATHGPVTRITVVGVVRMPMESVLSFAAGPLLITSPGYMAEHRSQIDFDFNNALVRLRHGAADVPQLKADVARLYGRDDIPVTDLKDDIKRVDNSLGVERTALLLFAAAVALAGLVLVGQGFVRSAQADAEDATPLRAMGFTRPQLVSGLALPHLLTIAAAAVTMVGTAVGLSGRFPIALGRRLDPDVGLHVAGGPIVIGLAVTIALTVTGAVVASWLAVRAVVAGGRARRVRIVGAASRAGAPIPAAVGASFALERGVGRTAAPVRPALVSAVVAVVGVVGALTLLAGINDALHTPARAGAVWDLEATPDSPDAVSVGPSGQVAVPGLAAVAGVHDAALMSRFPTTVDGQDAPIYGLDQIKGAIQFVILKGRRPAGPDEAVLGPRTAAETHASVGAVVTVGAGAQRFRVVGIGLLPQTPHTSFDEGAWVSMSAVDTVSGQSIADRDATVLVRLAPGADPDRAAQAMTPLGFDAEPPTSAPDVENLASVRALPLLLAGFLILLAFGAVGHALMSGSRRRRGELAVLRALGFTPRQAAWCVGWQAAVVGAVAVIVGIPLGLLVGRQLWSVVARAIPLVYIGPFDARILLAIPATVAFLGLLALLPARTAAHLRTAEVLRSE